MPNTFGTNTVIANVECGECLFSIAKNVNEQESECSINFVISESISQIFSAIVFDVIAAKIECDERLLKNNNATEDDEQKMMFTVLF
jgi:hypothetical protein